MEPIIDCEVHITWRSLDEIERYLPRAWHRRLRRDPGMIRPNFYAPLRGYHPDAARAPDGAPPGSDPVTVAHDWLDRHALRYAVLSHYDLPVISTWGDMDYPAALARAYNDWLIERWLAADPRFLGSMIVATQDPEVAAQEIERVGTHPQIVQVLVASGTRVPYGVRTFHPIYAAAERLGLPVAIHTGTEGLGIANPPTAAGWPSTYLEFYTCQPQNLAAHLTSLVTEGVFVKFPRLRMVFLEGGAAWAPPILWRLDKNYKALRSECPWLADLPSVYVKQHFRFGTHGLERPDDPARLWSFLRAMGAERLLMYGSNYPRRDLETLQESVALLTAEASVRRRIVFENAQELYRVPV